MSDHLSDRDQLTYLQLPSLIYAIDCLQRERCPGDVVLSGVGYLLKFFTEIASFILGSLFEGRRKQVRTVLPSVVGLDCMGHARSS